MRKDAQSELKSLSKQIAETQVQLQSALVNYTAQLDAESEMTNRIQRCEQRVAELYAKQGRKTQFKSQKERDVFLKKQIDDTKKTLAEEKKKVSLLLKHPRRTRPIFWFVAEWF